MSGQFVQQVQNLGRLFHKGPLFSSDAWKLRWLWRAWRAQIRHKRLPGHIIRRQWRNHSALHTARTTAKGNIAALRPVLSMINRRTWLQFLTTISSIFLSMTCSATQCETKLSEPTIVKNIKENPSLQDFRQVSPEKNKVFGPQKAPKKRPKNMSLMTGQKSQKTMVFAPRPRRRSPQRAREQVKHRKKPQGSPQRADFRVVSALPRPKKRF